MGITVILWARLRIPLPAEHLPDFFQLVSLRPIYQFTNSPIYYFTILLTHLPTCFLDTCPLVSFCDRDGYNPACMSENYSLYRTMLLIRRFEERALAEFSTGKLFGTTHAYIGQEADAAAIFSLTDPADVVFSSHRCHGHFLAYGGDPYMLAAELMGRSTGLVGGRGGSQHIHWHNFYSNGIQGGIVPVATGSALTEKINKTGKIALVFLGDGTLGEGALYESLNIASLWQIPLLFVVENNRYAQTTPVELGVSGSIPARFAAFNIRTWELDSTDVLEILPRAAEALAYVRGQTLPAALILHTYRFAAHSKGDDIRDRAEIARAKEKDPLLIHGERLTPAERQRVEADVMALIDDAFTRASADPFPATTTV
jgi:TPP-dependent pyruvate/acetoin dehydrogenase alpha subunit